jgi:GT2 family glycosyltransferase
MIDFGIVNYNGGDSLVRCVRSIQNLREVDSRVFVFDNNSKDDSTVGLDDSVFLEKNSNNLGYAGACNALLKRMDSPIQVLCNMDLEFDKNWGKEILTAFEKNAGCGSVASLVMEKSGVVNSTGILFYPDMHAENENSGRNIDELKPLKTKSVFGCYGAVMAFKKEVADNVGFLEDSFFLFFEETEWYFRHNLLGHYSVFCPSAVVWHERSKTTVRYSPLKLFYGERNRIRTAMRYLPLSYLLKLPLHSFKRYLKSQREMSNGDSAQTPKTKKYSKYYFMLVLLKAWLCGIFGKAPKFKLTRKDKRRVLEIIKNYNVNGVSQRDISEMHTNTPPPQHPPH